MVDVSVEAIKAQAPHALPVNAAEFLQRILESSQDCIKVIDLKGRLIYMNEGGLALMEIDNFERQAKHAFWPDFWQVCDRSAAQAAFESARAGETATFDGYCETAKGTPKWWNVAVNPILDANGQVECILSVSRDITERKLTEQALQARTQELDSFAYVVSHDLKAPLRAISHLSAWIEEDLGEKLPPNTQEQLELLRQRVSRMDGLIDGLLHYSRVGRAQFPVSTVDVADLLAEIIDSLSPPTAFSVVSISPLPVLATQRLLLYQVLANLISNAIKHHDQAAGCVQVSAIEHDTYFEFTVADDGPGIPETYREKVFEMFQTLDNNRQTDSTGIGLALVKKIIEGQGGMLTLKPGEPRGCQFCFTWSKVACP